MKRKYMALEVFLISANIIFFAVCVIFGLSTMTSFKPGPSYEDQAADASVFVSVDKGHGSGVIIAEGLVLTNRHVAVIKGGKSITFRGGAKRPARVLWVGAEENIEAALIAVDTSGHALAPLECAMPKRGDVVMTFGNPLMMRGITTYGRVAGFNTDPDVAKGIDNAVVLDMVVAPGNSGGAVFNAAGRVVGLATALVTSFTTPFGGYAPSGLSLMYPAAELCRLLGRV